MFFKIILQHFSVHLQAMDYFGNGIFYIGCSRKDRPITSMDNADDLTVWSFHFAFLPSANEQPVHHSTLSVVEIDGFVKKHFTGIILSYLNFVLSSLLTVLNCYNVHHQVLCYLILSSQLQRSSSCCGACSRKRRRRYRGHKPECCRLLQYHRPHGSRLV